jgi:imidazolonepropionase-like amidohydrolase
MDIYNTDYTQAEGKKNGELEENLRKDRELGEAQRENFRKAVKAARALDQEKTVGQIQTGKFGDIIGVAGDPLSDVTVLEHVAFVMKGGEVFKNETD